MKYYQSILVPTDFSRHCSVAAQRAREISESSGGKLTLIHVIDYLPPNYAAVELPAKYSSKEYMVERANQYMDDWCKENGLVGCERVVTTGNPKRKIVDKAEDINADMIALAPNMESKIARFFGSVTNAVAQAVACDVLIVRER